MKGDFGRLRFNPNRHYTVVLDQQGRVSLDSDANERAAIYEYLRRTEAVDVIGQYGGPEHDAGFAISVVGGKILIGPGRYYVEGLLCENGATRTYGDQPFYLDPGTTDTELLQQLVEAGTRASIQVFLQVWQRLVTVLDDACLREPALGQADTTCRLQTVWRVVATLNSPSRLNILETSTTMSAVTVASQEQVLSPAVLTSCCSGMYSRLAKPHTGSLSAQTSGGTADCGCQPTASAGYRGLENQLYRVEVHQSGNASTATFKWSRENGSVVVAVQSASGPNVVVDSLGPDANLGFKAGDWVELSDDTNLFGDEPNLPGALYQILRVDEPSLTVTMTTSVLPVHAKQNARMRRWEQQGTAATSKGVPLSASWIDLENGIQVRFGEGNYVSGDYWTIPARTATGNIEWPPCGGDGRQFQPPSYANIYFAPLACIHYAGVQRETVGVAAMTRTPFHVDDCRRLFPPLTELTPSPAATALHITQVNWLNDDVMTLDTLIANGLQVTFDQAPTSLVSASNFIVTLETPIVINRDLTDLVSATSTFSAQAQPLVTATPTSIASAGVVTPAVAAPAPAVASVSPTTTPAIPAAGPSVPMATIKGTPIGTAPTAAVLDTSISTIARFRVVTPTVPRTETILDSRVTAQGATVSWTAPANVTDQQARELYLLDLALLSALLKVGPTRLRVKLIGSTFFAKGSTGQLYLDGQAFGQTVAASSGTSQRTDLTFPSGSGAKASDFESWLFLYPILGAQSASFTYPALLASSCGGQISLYQSPLSGNAVAVQQQLTVYLNYPAVKAASLNLVLTEGDASIVTVPATFAVARGQQSVTIPIAINRQPSSTSPTTFSVAISVASAAMTFGNATASFTLAATQAPAPIIP